MFQLGMFSQMFNGIINKMHTLFIIGVKLGQNTLVNEFGYHYYNVGLKHSCFYPFMA